ncbi:MAG TPA: hypothetical protein ACFYED_00085 [Candidatus Tripitaka californicus]|uniref:hypothetical protein n=1 Tax=Candidatus Tripitaka californicus TaxID=3367616 RepID=UPI0040268B23
MSDELQSVLKELDQEYGFANLPDGVYHVGLGTNSKPVESDGKTPSYRVGWVVKDGNYSKREIGDFLRWFPSDPAKAGDRDAVRIVRAQVTQFVQAVASTIADADVGAAFAESVRTLRNSTSPEAAVGAIAEVVDIASRADLFVRLVTSKPKNATTTGFQNVRYMEKGEPIRGTAEATLEAVSI